MSDSSADKFLDDFLNPGDYVKTKKTVSCASSANGPSEEPDQLDMLRNVNHKLNIT